MVSDMAMKTVLQKNGKVSQEMSSESEGREPQQRTKKCKWMPEQRRKGQIVTLLTYTNNDQHKVTDGLNLASIWTKHIRPVQRWLCSSDTLLIKLEPS